MNETAADAEQARKKTDENTKHDPDERIESVVVVNAVCVDEVACRQAR